MQISPYISLVILAVGLLGSLLSIARHRKTPEEQRAVVIWLFVLLAGALSLSKNIRVLAVGTALILGVGLYSICRAFPIRKAFLIIRTSYRIIKINPSVTMIERMENWIRQHATERPAIKEEVDTIVHQVPMLPAPDQRTLEKFREEIFTASIISFCWHEEDGEDFDFDFDSFRFLNPDTPDQSLPLVKHHITKDIVERFAQERIDTIVYILRGRYNHRLCLFLDSVQPLLHATDLIGLPVTYAKRMRDSVLSDDLLKACAGKSVLLVEPLLIDRGLDEAYDKILQCRGTVNGVLVIFEVKDVSLKSLKHYGVLTTKSGQSELRGQIVLDLGKNR